MHGLTGDVISHLYRRSLEAQEVPLGAENGNVIYNIEVPTWGKGLLAVTILVFGLLLVSLRYTLWCIVPTLAAVETTRTTVIVKEEKPKLVDVLAEENIDEEVIIINNKPITSKIRSTIKHLRARAGYASRWRGLSVFLFYMFAHGAITEFLQAPIFRGFASVGAYSFSAVYGARMVASVIASILLARLTLTWTHVVISEPSSKPWFRRRPGLQAWKNVWAPTAAFDIACRLPFVVPAFFASATGLTRIQSADDVSPLCVASKLALVLMMGAVTFFGFAVPAYVALVRVQASMLPEEDESIVPFDRTFDGRVVPQILGGKGAIGYLDAWMTFDRPARLRMFRLVVKNIMIETALHVLFVGVLVTEVAMIVGPENIRKAIKHGQS